MGSVFLDPLRDGVVVVVAVVLSRIVPGDVDPGVELPSGSAVQDESLSFQRLHCPTAVQIHLQDVAHCPVYDVYP